MNAQTVDMLLRVLTQLKTDYIDLVDRIEAAESVFLEHDPELYKKYLDERNRIKTKHAEPEGKWLIPSSLRQGLLRD